MTTMKRFMRYLQDCIFPNNLHGRGEANNLSEEEIDTSQLSPILSSEESSAESMDEYEELKMEESVVKEPTIYEDIKEIPYGNYIHCIFLILCILTC